MKPNIKIAIIRYALCPYCHERFEMGEKLDMPEDLQPHIDDCATNPNNQQCGSCVKSVIGTKDCKGGINFVDRIRLMAYREKCSLWECKKSLLKYVDVT